MALPYFPAVPGVLAASLLPPVPHGPRPCPVPWLLTRSSPWPPPPATVGTATSTSHRQLPPPRWRRPQKIDTIEVRDAARRKCRSGLVPSLQRRPQGTARLHGAGAWLPTSSMHNALEHLELEEQLHDDVQEPHIRCLTKFQCYCSCLLPPCSPRYPSFHPWENVVR